MRVRSYDELSPMESRFSRVRAPRKRPKQLFPELECCLLVEGQPRELGDLSDTGARFLGDKDAREVGQQLQLKVRVGSLELLDVACEVVRVERGAGYPVAVRFCGGHIDIEYIALRHDDAVLHQRVQAPSESRSQIPAAYRELIDEITHFLLWHQTVLNTGLRGDADREILDSVSDTVSTRWRELCRLAEAQVTSTHLTVEQRTQMRLYTRTNVTTLLRAAPVVERAYSKPLGYPGDCELMRMIYEDGFEGETPFGRIFHRIILGDPMAVGGRARCAQMRDLLDREYRRQRQQGHKEFRVASLGCGPAREAMQWISGLGASDVVELCLIDQEREALNVARKSCSAAAKSGLDLRLSCHYQSFVEMLRDPSALIERGRPHLVYVTGVFDYLATSLGQRVVKSLLQSVEPGGSVVIANAKAPGVGSWCCDYVLDWSLIYRTADEVEALAALCPEGTTVGVESAPGDAFHSLVLSTPARE